MSRLGVLPVVGLLVVAAGLAGCGPTPSTGAGPSVVASAYPFAYVAQQVAGDRAAVVDLTPPGAEPHDLELSPVQTAQVADADLVVQLPGFQPAVDAVVTQSAPAGSVLDVSDLVAVRTVDGTVDPHVWLDPTVMVTLARQVADRLSSLDPEHAAGYAAAAATLVDRLRVLDTGFAHGLSGCSLTTFVTSHDAFHYLADRYGLTQLAITGLDPEVEATPHHLSQVILDARAARVTTVFTEPLETPASAEAVAGAIGATVAVLDPVESLHRAGDDYLSVMRRNLAALELANGCP